MTQSDRQLKHDIEEELRWEPKVTAKVHHGSVILEGQVSWNYQRNAAERAIRSLTGVVAVSNSIVLESPTPAARVKEQVQGAPQRQTAAVANSIHIDISGGKVTLTGQASSWQSVEDTANAAWAAPGVTEVVDRVTMSMTI